MVLVTPKQEVVRVVLLREIFLLQFYSEKTVFDQKFAFSCGISASILTIFSIFLIEFFKWFPNLVIVHSGSSFLFNQLKIFLNCRSGLVLMFFFFFKICFHFLMIL